MNVRRVTVALVAIVTLALPAEAIPADPDPTFSVDGRAIVAFSHRTQALGVAMQGSKIIVGGTRNTATGDAVLARLTKRGTLDPTFGKDGRLSLKASADGDWLDDLTVMPDGRIVAVGGAMVGGIAKFLAVRLLPDGALDPTFGGDGIVLTGFAAGASAESVALAPDGAILVGGAVGDVPTSSFCVVRYLANGRRDRSFSGDGIALVGFPTRPYAFVADLVPWRSPADHVLAVGVARDGSEEDVAVVSLGPDGKLDREFGGGDGRTLVDVGPWDRAASVVLQDLGFFIVAGWSNPGDASGAMFVRFNASGHVDFEWGDAGVVLHDALPAGFDYWQGAVRTGSKIVVAGSYLGAAAVMRIRANGDYDQDFGDGGLGLMPFDGGESSFGSVTVQTDGRLVLAGYAPDGTETGFAVARLLA
jgi:uncharacterized delta-60 repeat protein